MTSETTYNSAVSGSYLYDGDGRRVVRNVNGVVTWQVYGVGGELIAEYGQNGSPASPQKEYGYRNGQLLITAAMTAGGWGAAPSYTGPNPLSTGDQIKLENLTELRSAVNSLRSHAGLSAYNFTVDPSPDHSTTVKADHIRQLRTALEQARAALGLSTGGYTNPTLTEGSSTIYAIDFQEIRNQIASAWNNSTSSLDLRWMVTDQLGTPRMIFDLSGSLASVGRHDYLPFGEELFAGIGGRTTAQGYSLGDGARQKFTQKERDNETGLDYFGARYFASTQGRFTGVDPINLTKYHIADPQRWNGYTYAINNPLVMIDLDGKFAWTFFIRSFIFTSTVAGGWYGGDARGPSTADSPDATSRAAERFTLDIDKSQITEHSVFSDYSRLLLPGGWSYSKRPTPHDDFAAVETFAGNQKVTELNYWAKDPIPGYVTPDLDVHAKLAVTEDKTKGILSISGRVTGDTFPSTEAFIVDQSGKRVFLGAKYEEGGLGALIGDNKKNLFEINMKIRFDKKGNFTGVIVDGKHTP